MAAVFAKHDVGAVIHFAGLKAVGESVAKPQLYYEVNVQGTLVLLEVMPEAGWLGLRLTQAQALTQTLTLTLTRSCPRRAAATCKPRMARTPDEPTPRATTAPTRHHTLRCTQAGLPRTRVLPCASGSVFSSSATVYGDPASVPVDESFPTGPTNPCVSPLVRG